MKNRQVIMITIVILSIIIILLIIGMVYLMNGKMRFSSFPNKISKELVIDENYQNNKERIKLEAKASDVSIKTTNEDRIRVVVYGEKEKIEIKDNDNELLIKIKAKNCYFFCFTRTLTKVEVYLPKNFANSIDINNDYGDIEIEEFGSAIIDIEENCGDISIQEAKKANITNDYGDIKIEKVQEATIKASAGDVNIGTVNHVTVKNNLGDIHIKNVLAYLDVKDDCGNVKIDNLSIQESSHIENNLGDIKIGSTNDIYIDANVSLGDIKINHNSRKSDVTLAIKNSCGDINVNN